MNSIKIYNNLIEKITLENRTKNNITYYEKHHINPKFNGGSDKKENLVLLTYREHVLLHWLLTRIFPNNYKASCAFSKMFVKSIKHVKGRDKFNINEFEAMKRIYISNLNKPIICLENTKIFSSINEASKYYNTTASNLSICLKGKTKTAAGHHWMYLKDYNSALTINISYYPKKPVICVETKKIFSSLSEASIYNNIDSRNLSNICNKYLNRTLGGYHWMFLSDFKKLKEPIKYTKMNNDKTKKVINITTKKIFDSILEASTYYSVDKSSISRCCRNISKRAGKFEWSYYMH